MSLPVNDIIRDTAFYAGISNFQCEPLDSQTIMNGAIISSVHNLGKDYVQGYVEPYLSSVPVGYRLMVLDGMSLFGSMYGVNKFYLKNPTFDMKKSAIKSAAIAGAKKLMTK